jgi:hypothetical protein
MSTENMPTVGALARFEAKPGNEADVEHFFQEGLPIVQRQPASTLWFGFRLGPTTFGAFAAFANEEDRHALLSTGGPVLAESNAALFAHPPTFEKVEIFAARLAESFGMRDETGPTQAVLDPKSWTQDCEDQ